MKSETSVDMKQCTVNEIRYLARLLKSLQKSLASRTTSIRMEAGTPKICEYERSVVVCSNDFQSPNSPKLDKFVLSLRELAANS